MLRQRRSSGFRRGRLLAILLAEQSAGISAFYVLPSEDGSILGRFNLVDIRRGDAEVGYRVAEHVAGRGVETAAVQRLCQLAVTDHGLRTLRAATASHSIASQKVLTNAGFRRTGPANPAHLGGKPGIWYQRELADGGVDAPPIQQGASDVS